MKRGGMFFAAFLLAGGVLQIAGPRSANSNNSREERSAAQAAGSGQEKAQPQGTYFKTLGNALREFFPDFPQDFSPLSAKEKAVQNKSGNMVAEQAKFVIAILPDPVHTRLGLFFDRSIEALQQGAQAKGYVFDRAAMPWPRSRPNESKDTDRSEEEKTKQQENETLPGVLIFRSGNVGGETSPKGTLLVFVVGETPTAGLNKPQFRHALRIISNLNTAAPQPLLVLGPTFSGSLESLEAELQTEKANNGATQTFVYSGTVTSASAISAFQAGASFANFASFQENDDYARARFLQFACDRGYKPYEIAVLSEDETVYGSMPPEQKAGIPEQPNLARSAGSSTSESPSKAASSDCKQEAFQDFEELVVKLHFPREISYFRSAYQKEMTAQPSPSSSSAVPTLPMNLDESGSDDDSVAPYAAPQTALSQEAVMLGIVSELQKHRIKFTMVLATDPVDSLFLATYLRQAYGQGQVVISVPDLLFARESTPGLRGVLSLNSYSLISGLSDRLCRQKASADLHHDRLFVSSGSVGTFNAMVGLLSAGETEPQANAAVQGTSTTTDSQQTSVSASKAVLPDAPYAEYGSPGLRDSNVPCRERPLLWLTILGRDGFWPVVGFSQEPMQDEQLPVAFFPTKGQPTSTLPAGKDGDYSLRDWHDAAEEDLRLPGAWKIAYCLCLMLLILHVTLSLSGSVLADSETRAQFARSTDRRGHAILAIGAFALASAFVLVTCMRAPAAQWAGNRDLTYLLWLPYPLLLVATIWDLWKLRRAPLIAWLFTAGAIVMTVSQMWLAWGSSGAWRVFWSTRMLFLSSGVSPILPVLLLMGAGYWWMWISLRGVCLVDLRRPRLPDPQDLPPEAYRVSDTEAEELRKTAHPFFFAWQVLLPLFILGAVVCTVLDFLHPVQTIEGWPFDLGYALLLGLIVGTFLGCLFKLLRTWLKCRQVLAGLDRMPLRVAFRRMKDLSWHSFWNPGGSSLRETYKVMERATENQTHLLALVENWNTPMGDDARRAARKQIRATIEAREALVETYRRIFPANDQRGAQDNRDSVFLVHLKQAASWIHRVMLSPRKTFRSFVLKDFKRGCFMSVLLRRVETLQKEMARTAGVLAKSVLSPLWAEEAALTVSTDERLAANPLPIFRAMAEEYVALVYVNFLVSVLLRIRTLVICAGGLFVLIVLSLNTYPFEPRPALQALAVLLLVAMAAAVGYVYAEMHRDGILSYLTSTKPGELGLDFWLKFISAGAIPVFSLLAAQFPSVNQFLFSWLEPALQALK